MLARRNINQIWKIKAEDGRIIEDEDGIRDEAERYFKEILAPTEPMIPGNDQWQPNRVLDDVQKATLIREVNEDEINEVIWNGTEEKSPRLDEFTLTFFKSAWEIVGREVIHVITLYQLYEWEIVGNSGERGSPYVYNFIPFLDVVHSNPH